MAVNRSTRSVSPAHPDLTDEHLRAAWRKIAAPPTRPA